MKTLSPKLGEMLLKTTGLADPDLALEKVIHEYLELKINNLKMEREGFVNKWNMSFPDFQQRCKDNTLDIDAYAYQVEKDYWEWERVETLLADYDAIRASWE